MKQVEFVRVIAHFNGGFGLMKGIESSFEGIEDTIRERIENGWKFDGYVPIATRGTGEIETLSLVFEKDTE